VRVGLAGLRRGEDPGGDVLVLVGHQPKRKQPGDAAGPSQDQGRRPRR
jgi:hypothetical protein